MKLTRLLFLLILLFILNHSTTARVYFKRVSISSGTYLNSLGYLDFNDDGIIDINLTFESFTILPPQSPAYFCGTTTTIPRLSYGERILFNEHKGSGFYASPNTGLALGVIIDDTRAYTTTYSALYFQGGDEYHYNHANSCYYNNSPIQYSPGGLWRSNPEGYLGLRFKINNLWHYGYLRIEKNYSVAIGSPGHYIITEMAYEEVPGYPITTGDRNGFDPSLPAGTYNIIKGKVFIDLNQNCIFDSWEQPIDKTFITAKSGANYYYAISDASGNYSIDVQGGSLTYQVHASQDTLPGQNFRFTCLPAEVSLAGTGVTVSNKNFGVQLNSCPLINTSINSDRRRRCFRNNTIVTYSNYGVAGAANAVFKVVYPTYVKPISSVPAWDVQVDDTLIFNIGSIPALSNGTIKIIDSVVCDNEGIRVLTQCTKVIIKHDNSCLFNGSWDNSDILINASCLGAQTRITIRNIGSGDMSDSSYYRLFLDNVEVGKLKYKLVSGEEKVILINNEGKAVRAEADLTPGHPNKKTEIAVIEGCGDLSSPTISKGIINYLPVNGTDPKVAISCLPIRDSYDPNDKQVYPSGFGAGNKILPNQRMHFQIRFQNTGSDTAYSVVVVDTLAADLDIASLRIESVSHNYKLSVSGKNKVVLKFTFGGIMLVDKATNEPASHGVISFSINQKADLPIGTILKNKAYIFFDYNSPIVTNETSNEIFSSHPKRPKLIFNNLTKTYGDPSFNLSLISSSRGSNTFASISGSAVNVSSNGSVTIQAAGTVLIKGEVAAVDEYVQWSDTMTLSVEKAILTVSAENKTRDEGAANPSLSYMYNGFVYGEDQGVLEGTPQVSSSADISSSPGIYPIIMSAGTLSSANYSFQFIEGTLEVQVITGINTSLSSSMNIYPNPSLSGRLFIETNEEIEMVILVNSVGETQKYFSKSIETDFKGMVDLIIYTRKGITQKRLVIY